MFSSPYPEIPTYSVIYFAHFIVENGTYPFILTIFYFKHSIKLQLLIN